MERLIAKEEASVFQQTINSYFRRHARVKDAQRGYIEAPWVAGKTNPEIQRAVASLVAYRFADSGVTAAVGIPTLGVGLGVLAADRLNVPHISGRKDGTQPGSWNDVIRTDQIHSFTTGNTSRFLFFNNGGLKPNEHILLVDDFMAHGTTAVGVARAFLEAGAKQVSLAVHVAKLFQGGVTKLEELGVEVYWAVGVKGIAPNNSLLL